MTVAASNDRHTAREDACPATPGASPRSVKKWQSLVVASGLLATIAITRLVAEWHLPFPSCWLRRLTGIPCPTCGCTRSLLAWAEGDPGQAFFLNPLFFLLCVGVLVWPMLAAGERISGRAWFPRARVSGRRLWLLAAVLIVLNWLYLCLRLPK